MTGMILGTNDLRAGLISVLAHAERDPKAPDGLKRVRLEPGVNNVTLTATDSFSAGLAIVSIWEHTAAELTTIDLAPDDADKILHLFKGGSERSDEPEKMLRIDTTDTHVVVTDVSGLEGIEGRVLTVRIRVDAPTQAPRRIRESATHPRRPRGTRNRRPRRGIESPPGPTRTRDGAATPSQVPSRHDARPNRQRRHRGERNTMTTSEVQAVHEKEFAANYRGDTTDVIGQRVGPNTMGEHFKAVSAEYDPTTDRTRVVFDLIPAPAHAGQAKYYDGHLNETRRG